MSRWPINPLTKAQLDALANPQSAQQPEVIPWAYYDTQPLTTGTGPLLTKFFVTVNNDSTKCNLPNSGMLPSDQYLQVYFFSFDLLFPAVTTTTTVAGDLTDTLEIINNQRATFTFELSQKKYGPIPVGFAHGLAGAVGVVTGTTAAAGSTQVGQNGVQDGGWWCNGQIVIPPMQTWTVTLNLAAAPTLNTSPLQVRCSLIGNLYRRVL